MGVAAIDERAVKMNLNPIEWDDRVDRTAGTPSSRVRIPSTSDCVNFEWTSDTSRSMRRAVSCVRFGVSDSLGG